MPDSIRETIMKLVKTRLETITIANGYVNTVLSVQRFTQSGQIYASTPMVVIHEGDDVPTDGPLAGAVSLTSRTVDLALEVVIRHNESTDSRSSEEIMNTLRTDIEKAVMTDRTWSGYAVDTSALTYSPVFVEEGQPDVSSFAEMRIAYRHRATDPSQLV